jgi:hypothetical protein
MTDPTSPSDSTPEPDGRKPPFVGPKRFNGGVTHVSDTPLPLRAAAANAAILSTWRDVPQPPQPPRSPPVDPGGPAKAQAGELVRSRPTPTLEGASMSAHAEGAPPRRSPPFVPGGPTEPALPPPTTPVVVHFGVGIENTAAVGAAAGVGVASGVGTSIAEGVGTASGSGAVHGYMSSTEAPDVVDIRVDVDPPTVESLWKVVLAQRALMEATIRAIPSAARHIGPDHNGGPDLVPNAAQDLISTNHIIDLLSDNGPRTKGEIQTLIEAANAAIVTASKGKSALNVFAMGVIAGAGQYAGHQGLEALVDTPWWTAFYERLAELASAVLAWAHLVV